MSDAETTRVTYVDLAKARGISVAAARRLTQRHKWPKQIGNDGFTRVIVPTSMLVAWDSDAYDDSRVSGNDACDDVDVNGEVSQAHVGVDATDDTGPPRDWGCGSKRVLSGSLIGERRQRGVAPTGCSRSAAPSTTARSASASGSASRPPTTRTHQQPSRHDPQSRDSPPSGVSAALHPCPSARPGVARGRAAAREGDHPACTSPGLIRGAEGRDTLADERARARDPFRARGAAPLQN